MTGRQIALTLGFPTRGLHYVDETDGRAAVIGGYTTGDRSTLIQGQILYRPPGSSIWLVRVDPRETGDGPSYMIDAAVAGRFVPLVVPPVPSLDDRLRENQRFADTFTRTQVELNEADMSYWQSAAVTDFKSELSQAPKRLGKFYGGIAGGAVKLVSEVAGGAAAAFYGSLPFWLQVGIPVAIVGAGVAGAVAVVRAAPKVSIGS